MGKKTFKKKKLYKAGRQQALKEGLVNEANGSYKPNPMGLNDTMKRMVLCGAHVR